MKQLDLKVAGTSPATAFYSEDGKFFNVVINTAYGYKLKNTCVKYKTGKDTWKQVNFKSSNVKQPKDLYCTYILEFSSWSGTFYLTFSLGLPPITNFKYKVLKNGTV